MSHYDEYESDELSEEEVDVPVAKKRKPKKDPSRPKRNMSAFFLFSQANRAQVKADNSDASFGDIARLLSAQFKALPEKEHQKWVKKAEKDKLRYQEEMKHYVPPSDDDEPTGKKRKKKDPNAPKRNMSAFFLYSNNVRASIKEANPSLSFGDIARTISAQYKALSDKDRTYWEGKAAEDKERYQKEMEVYKGEP